jgi:hypothetical protein
VYYTFADGPRKGKRDKEVWDDGKLVASHKHYGAGETTDVEDWDDLAKLDELAKACSPVKQSFFNK